MEKVKFSFILKLVFIGFILSGISAVVVMKLLFAISTISMPDFTGLPLVKAQQIGSRVGVDVKVENEVDSNMYEKGCIVSQDMPPRSKIKKGRSIYVVVSRGSKIVPVPGVVGSLDSKAVVDLRNANLDTGYEASVSSFVAPKDMVIAQSPPADENVPTGSTINILKSSGPKKLEFLMPNFKGMNISGIYSAMKEYKLVISSLTVKDDDTMESGTVIDETPSAGYKINDETPVSFIVSKKTNDTKLRQRYIKFSYKQEGTNVPVLVKILVLSLNGSETVFNEMAQPGRVINESATVRGDALVQVFSGTQVIKEMEFKLEDAK
jgi:beta-lactam-binding protein with PASTA domain